MFDSDSESRRSTSSFVVLEKLDLLGVKMLEDDNLVGRCLKSTLSDKDSDDVLDELVLSSSSLDLMEPKVKEGDIRQYRRYLAGGQPCGRCLKSTLFDKDSDDVLDELVIPQNIIVDGGCC